MKKLKIFFKNLEAEYLRIAETRKICPHVIKFERVTNYIFAVIIALAVVFGIATSASAEEPTTVEPLAGTSTISGVYKFTSSNLGTAQGFTIDDVRIFTLNTLGISADNNIYDGIRFNKYSNEIELRDESTKEWTSVYKNGVTESFISSYIYIPLTVVPISVYREFTKLYSRVTTDTDLWIDFTECYRNGGLDAYSKYFPEGYDVGYAKGYDDGYDVGHVDGYDVGHVEGYDEGYDVGHVDGYDEGYDFGFDVGLDSAKPFTNIIGDIFEGLDNFTIFADFSILDIIKSIMGVFLAVWLLKLIAGG